MSQRLASVRQAAKKDSKLRFTALLHHLTTDRLRGSFYSLKRSASPGVDGMRWHEYEDGLQARLSSLHRRVHRGGFRAQQKRVNHVLDADIRGFFENLDKPWMMEFIKHRVADRRVLRLIQKWLRAVWILPKAPAGLHHRGRYTDNNQEWNFVNGLFTWQAA